MRCSIMEAGFELEEWENPLSTATIPAIATVRVVYRVIQNVLLLLLTSVLMFYVEGNEIV